VARKLIGTEKKKQGSPARRRPRMVHLHSLSDKGTRLDRRAPTESADRRGQGRKLQILVGHGWRSWPGRGARSRGQNVNGLPQGRRCGKSPCRTPGPASKVRARGAVGVHGQETDWAGSIKQPCPRRRTRPGGGIGYSPGIGRPALSNRRLRVRPARRPLRRRKRR